MVYREKYPALDRTVSPVSAESHLAKSLVFGGIGWIVPEFIRGAELLGDLPEIGVRVGGLGVDGLSAVSLARRSITRVPSCCTR